MRRNLGVDDLGDLLERPILGVLAIRLPDGSTLLSAVWHEWHDDGFRVCIPLTDAKLDHIRRDPRVSILVAENALPYRGLEVRGRAALTSEPYPAAMRRLALRHFGPGSDALYPDTALGVVVRIAPDRIRGWDFADAVAAMESGAG